MTTAVVTGAASGIGAAVRRRLVADGVDVLGIDLTDTDIVADLSAPEGRSKAVDEVLARTEGRIDRLVTCAGVGPTARPLALIVSVNYFGTIELLDGMLEALAAGDRAAAVTIGSNSAPMFVNEEPPLLDALLDGDEAKARAVADRYVGPAVYAVSKQAIVRAVRDRAAAWGAAGVRLNALAPGPVETPLLKATIDDPDLGPLVGDLPIPLDRLAHPGEIASLAAFLVSADAGYVHGSVLYADGGTDAVLRPDLL